MSLEPTSLGPNWWVSLNHGGLLIAPPMVKQFFDDDLAPLRAWRAEALRRALTRRSETGVAAMLDTTFLQVLGYETDRWNRNPPAAQWSHRLLTGDSERPRRLYESPSGKAFPIFIEKPDVRLGLGRGRRSVARVVEWLRQADLKLALLATEQQWRLIYAGSDFEAWCEWNLDLWFELGQPAEQVEALRHLMDPAAVPERLLEAIQDSRRGQAELTSALGERVRQAVEKLIQSSAANLDSLDVLPNAIYLAATRMIMRCVVALFAEGKGMLGRDMPAYHDSYGVAGLREQLERVAHGRLDALNETRFAWPRLMALFRLIHDGSSHPQLTAMRYGGTLFEPGRTDADDPVLRAIAAFEKTHPCPRDRDVYEIVLLLTRTYVKVSQGKGARAIAMPVDFSNLDTEYIGILYEGLLDYDLRKADEAVVFVRMGDEPALKVSDLETLQPAKLKEVFGKLQKKSTLAAGDDDSDDAVEDDAVEEETETAAEVLAEPEVSVEDAADANVRRAHDWAVLAVKAAGMVRAPRKSTPDALRRYDAEVDAAARNLFSRVVRPGDWYLVRFGNTRKGSGTFYTRKELASPTVRRTLAPLVYNDDGSPRKPEEILTVKVCDPAVGSGSFLISALRYLTDGLFKALYAHGRINESGGNKFYDLGIGPPEYLPDDDEFDSALKARLRRYVVERCLYGVDLNPLAIELARMSLWIETMDARLPFGFLDHKLRPGNALVGCWFDRFQDYPVMAWMREGGDKDYEPVNPRANWTKAIAAELRERVKPGLVRMISAGAQQHLPLDGGKSPSEIGAEVRGLLNRIHELSVTDPDRQRKQYQVLRDEPGFKRLLQAFDTWCALWFWPGDELRKAPIAADFLTPSDDALVLVRQICERYRFFHWELEFPDVFATPGSGFDAVVGNPPWEIQKPNSKEFFSNLDPLYRGYGKQEAMKRQKDYFKGDTRHEQSWMAERGRLKALSNWVKYAANPFGDRVTHDGQDRPEFDYGLGSKYAASVDLHERWSRLRSGRIGFADNDHPFRLQGSADLNTYKMFLELALTLVRSYGRVGILVPGGVYSDLGSSALRDHLLKRCAWTHLYGFQNERFVFANVHHSYKVAVLSVTKSGRTDEIKTQFRLGPGDSPTVSELDLDLVSGDWLDIDTTRIQQFSPKSKVVLEVRSERELRILEKLYTNGVLLGDQSPDGWDIQFGTEFHMTNDSALFPPRGQWETRGFRADEYGHWLSGAWRPYSGPKNFLDRERGLLLSALKTHAIRVTEIEDVALPLYQGIMLHQFDFSAKGWVRGTGFTATWEEVPWNQKALRPQYLMSQMSFPSRSPTKLGYRRIARTTDTRTFISAELPPMPCGDAVFLMTSERPEAWLLPAITNSFVFDQVTRVRLGGTNLNFFFVSELPALTPEAFRMVPQLPRIVAGLSFPSELFARTWLIMDRGSPWRYRWAVTKAERIRSRSILDAAIARMYGLNADDFRHILRDCDHPISAFTDRLFTRTLDPKGFWRVDKEKQPELRHTVLSLVAFHELERIGLNAFLALNDGEGWMLPETLRLADYGLGHDDRAREHQPVASVLGPRYYDWQLSQSVEESWEECERHAELLSKIIPPPKSKPSEPVPETSPQTDLFGEPLETDLFGDPVYPAPGGRRR